MTTISPTFWIRSLGPYPRRSWTHRNISVAVTSRPICWTMKELSRLGVWRVRIFWEVPSTWYRVWETKIGEEGRGVGGWEKGIRRHVNMKQWKREKGGAVLTEDRVPRRFDLEFFPTHGWLVDRIPAKNWYRVWRAGAEGVWFDLIWLMVLDKNIFPPIEPFFGKSLSSN